MIFTERIETLHFLQHNLLKDLKLKENQVEILYGGMSDVDPLKLNFIPEQYPENDEINIVPGFSPDISIEEIITRHVSGREEPPRWVILVSNTQILLLDRTKWHEKCTEKAHYDVLDLIILADDYLPRTNYVPNINPDEYKKRTPNVPLLTAASSFAFSLIVETNSLDTCIYPAVVKRATCPIMRFMT